MMQYRHDPLPQRLMITLLLVLNTVAIREEYLEKASLGWVSITCFLLVILVLVYMKHIEQRC